MKEKLWRNKGVSVLLLIALVSLNIWLLSMIDFIFEPVAIVLKAVMFPIVLAGVFYYLLHPVVDWAESQGVRRGTSIVLLFISIAWFLAMALAFVLPTLFNQVKELISLIPTWWEKLLLLLDNWTGPAWTQDIVGSAQVMISDMPAYMSDHGSKMLMQLGSQVFPLVGTITGLVMILIIAPFVLFYLLKDGKELPEQILKFFPVHTRRETKTILREMNHQISQYIRGQILVSLCIGVLLYFGYLIIGLPYALTLAIVASLTSVVPYIGPTIAISPAIILSFFISPIMLVKLLVVWTVVQLIDGKGITPQVMGRSIRVHPVTIVFVILCAGKLFGLIGLVFAIPSYAVLKVIATHAFTWIKDVTGLYNESSEIAEPKKIGS